MQALTNALEQQRLHHAYLFTGTRGVGKTTVSRILAKSLNCTGRRRQGGITADALRRLPGLHRRSTPTASSTTSSSTPRPTAASTRSADLLERAVYKPEHGPLQGLHDRRGAQLTKDAFNALLKTLEEPPDYLKFVLATTDPQKMLPTVLSRCLQFNLRPMAPETVREHLAQVLEAEAVPVDAQALRLLSRAARGSMRDALSLTDQAIAFGGGALDEASGAPDAGQRRPRPCRAAARGAGRSATARRVLADGRRAARARPVGRGHARGDGALLQQMAVRAGGARRAATTADPDTAERARLAALMPADETQLLYSMCCMAAPNWAWRPTNTRR